MLIAVTSTSFIGLWIGISATTLATTFLVGFSGGKAALEAAWKYLMLCSFGIAIALIGIFLLGHAALTAHLAPAVALSWDTVARNGGRLSPELARVALLLMLLGFGTKAGLVPMHSWLPDAHSKAPAPISALLSGLLVSCSLYAIVRTQHVAALAHDLARQSHLALEVRIVWSDSEALRRLGEKDRITFCDLESRQNLFGQHNASRTAYGRHLELHHVIASL